LKAYIVETVVGVFAYDEEGNRIAGEPYPKAPEQISTYIRGHREGQMSVPMEKLLEALISSGYNIYASSNQVLLKTIEERYGKVTEASGKPITEFADAPDLAVETGFASSAEEYRSLSHAITSLLAKQDVHQALSYRESLLIPTVQLLGDLDTVINSLSGRMREWYGVHFPEMGHRVREHTDYAKIILAYGDRENITVKGLQEMSLKKRDADRVVEAAQGSMGATLDEEDVKALQSYTQGVLDLYNERERLTEYISALAQEIAPNVIHLAGPVLGAKLIDKAGGLRRMAMMPSSTIQVLGAEKAMFRALKSKAKPPKHGLLFQHPYVHSAPRDKRGSRARALAAKLAIAARADVFSGEFIADDLLAHLADY
jgi:nucleolar protein 56